MSEAPKDLEGVAVGGHGGTALIQTGDGKIKKRVNRDPEVNFYKGLENRKLGDGLAFIPKYFGTEIIDGANFIVMEDLTFQKAKCCMLDIKMGTQTFGPDAKEEKKLEMAAKDASSTTKELGQRITGYRTWKGEEFGYLKVGKDITKKITKAEYTDHIRTFFTNEKGLRTDIVKHFLVELKKLQAWYQTQSEMMLISSSILFCYDALNDKPNGDLRMIDFAHVFDLKEGEHDEGYLFGLKLLINYFEDLSA